MHVSRTTMTLQQIYELAIRLGLKNDFRSKKEIDEKLKREKKRYAKLEDVQKQVFDKERLSNPYSDTRILWGNPKTQVKRVLVGIDMETPELLLARELGDIDLVIAHHPEGIALAGLDEVMDLQIDVLAQYGVPINIAENYLKKRVEEVGRGLSPGNHNRAVDAAWVLKQPFMCVHTPSDNMVAQYVKSKVEAAKPRYVGEILEILLKIPEYKKAAQLKIGPRLFSGSRENRAGRIAFTEITGGTEGSPEIYQHLAQAGIGTVIGMHMSEKHVANVKKAYVNAVIAGHMSSDSVGMNLFLDELEKRGVKIVPVSGFIRVSRTRGR